MYRLTYLNAITLNLLLSNKSKSTLNCVKHKHYCIAQGVLLDGT